MKNKQSDFFVTPKSLGLATTVATLLASSAGVWILFSPVETISWAGISGLTGYAFGQALPLLVIAVIGIHMLKALPNDYSLPQWAQLRYGRYMRVVTLLVCLFYLVIFLSAELTAIGQAGELLGNGTIPAAVIITVVTLLTWSYTHRGGFRLVVKTDIVQLLLLLPILVLILIVVISASPKPLLSNIKLYEPQLLSFTHVPGIEFAITLIIAISAAQIFNQSLWQRVYAASNEKTMRIAFIIAGLLMIPLVFATGYLGLIARDAQVGLEEPAIGIFALILEYADWWLVLGIGLVALFLVMSSADSILNALSVLVAEELEIYSSNSKHINLKDATNTYITKARWITSFFALTIAIIASQGYSVLYLFLIADLLCAGSVVPVFAGLYTKRLNQQGACISVGLGIASGVLFMLQPDLRSPLINNPIGSSWLLSFGSAMLVSTLSTLIFISWRRK